MSPPVLSAICREYYDVGSPTEIDQALQLLVATNINLDEATKMLADSSGGATGKGNAQAPRCRTLLRVAELLDVAEKQGLSLCSAAEVVERFNEVALGLEHDIVIELLLEAHLNDMVAVEHMFNGGSAAVPTNDPAAFDRCAEEAARRELEARVRMEATAREHQAQVAAIEQLTREAESRRPVAQAVVMELLEGQPKLSGAVDAFIRQFQGEVSRGSCSSCEPVREFMDRLTTTISNDFATQLTPVIKSAGSASATDEDVTMLLSVIEDCLQNTVVMPLQHHLMSAYQTKFAKEDAELLRRQGLLKTQPQSFFGIPQHAITTDGWSQAVDALSDLDDALHVTPNMRLKILTYVKVAIERCYQAESHARGLEQQPLCADDILPIFSFILARSTVRSIYAVTEYLRDITAPGITQHGEAAYYQCVLEAAINHLLSLDLSDMNTHISLLSE